MSGERGGGRWADVAGARADDLGVLELLDDVRRRLVAAADQRGVSEPERERLMAGMKNGIGSVEECIEHVRRFIELGARSISVTRANQEGIRKFAEEVVPNV